MKFGFNYVIIFTDLHLTANIKAAKVALKGKMGIYAIVCLVTGAVYIGSSIYLDVRLIDHFVENNTNEHLQSAIYKHGLDNFIFYVIEFVQDVLQLLVREQYYLDILFTTIPAALIYNFAKDATASRRGINHTEESKAKISEALKGNQRALGNLQS